MTSGSREPSSLVVGWSMALVVVIWGLGPPVTKLISAPPLVGVSVRFWISVPLVWAVTYATGRRMTWPIVRRTALAGVLFGSNLAFMFAAVTYIPVAVLSVVVALQPGVVLLVAGPMLGERASRWHVAWTLVGLGGVSAVILGGGAALRADALGLLLAVGTLLTFTFYYLITRRVRTVTSIDSFQWMAGVTLVAAVVVTPVALVVSSVDDYRQFGGLDWLYVGFIAVAIGIFGHTLMSWCHRYIDAARSSLYVLGMHVVAIGTAWPLHDEPMSVVQLGGAAVVLGAVAAVVSRPPAPVHGTRASTVHDEPAGLGGP